MVFTWKCRYPSILHSYSQEITIVNRNRQEPLPDKNTNRELILQQLVTIGDLEDFRVALLHDIKQLLELQKGGSLKKWLKSYEVEKLFGISPNTLLTWRSNGTLPYTPLGGIFYYDPVDIEKLMQEKKVVTKQNP